MTTTYEILDVRLAVGYINSDPQSNMMMMISDNNWKGTVKQYNERQ